MKTNFLCLIPDQFRHDLLGCAGHPAVRTPHLDALAAGGVRFDRCYTVQPMCMATRSTWFTGRTPRGHGVRENGIPLDPRIPTMTEALRRAGYRTHSIGKLHLNPWMPHKDLDPAKLTPEEWPEAIPLWKNGRIRNLPSPYYGIESADVLISKKWGHYREWLLAREPRGFELMTKNAGGFQSVEHTPDVTWKSELPSALHPTAWAAECAEKFLNRAKKEAKLFFLWCSIPDPHPPYTVADPYYSMYDPRDMPSPKRRDGELDSLPWHYRHIYEKDLFTAGRIKATRISESDQARIAAVVCGMVTQWDAMVGRIINKLKETGLYDDTAIVFMSDHGQMLGDHWMQNMPPALLDGSIRVPCIWHFPKQFKAGRVSPALASHLDFAPTMLDIAGVPIPEGNVPPQPEAPGQRRPWPGQSLVPLLTGEKQSVQDSVIIENDADYLGMRQRTLVTERYHINSYIGEGYGELFDLQDDPDQLRNLWDDPRHADLKKDLIVRMFHRFGETDSVLPRRLGHA